MTSSEELKTPTGEEAGGSIRVQRQAEEHLIVRSNGGTEENSQGDLEQVKLEVNCRLEEYKSLRAEIVATLTAAYNTTALTLTGAGVLVAGSPFIIANNKPPVLFLAASLIFCGISLSQLRYQQAVFNMSEHIINVVSPAIRQALGTIAKASYDQCSFDTMLSWEKSGRVKNHANEKKFYPLEMSRPLMPLLTASIAIIAYPLTVKAQQTELTSADWIAIAITSSVLLYSTVISWVLRLRLKGRADEGEARIESNNKIKS